MRWCYWLLVLLVGPCYAQDSLLHAVHHHLAVEGDDVDDYLHYHGFVVKYNYTRKVPAYTVHCLTPQQLDRSKNKAKRKDVFWEDVAQLGKGGGADDDYLHSGYDRGHHVPAGDFYWHQGLKKETFVYSNISPQNPTLNRGAWARLERTIRQKVVQYQQKAYVVTGTVYPPGWATSIGKHQVGVATHLYKLVYFPQKKEMYAFMFDNTIASYHAALRHFQVTVDEIELITGEDFFDGVEEALEQELEGKVMVWF